MANLIDSDNLMLEDLRDGNGAPVALCVNHECGLKMDCLFYIERYPDRFVNSMFSGNYSEAEGVCDFYVVAGIEDGC